VQRCRDVAADGDIGVLGEFSGDASRVMTGATQRLEG